MDVDQSEDTDTELDRTFEKPDKDDDYVPPHSMIPVDRSTKEEFIFKASKSAEVTAVADR